MELRKLVKMMGMLGTVSYNSSNIRNLIIQSLKDKSGVVNSAKYYDSWKKDTPDMLSSDVWQTYEKCRDFTFSLEGDSVKCDIVIYEGDMLYGNRQEPRVFADITLPLEFLHNMKEEITRQFDILLDFEYDDFLERQRGLWKERQKKKWLDGK